jgi:hypothetical protein
MGLGVNDKKLRNSGIEGFRISEWGMRNAENPKPNTKHKTPNTVLTFNPKSEI